MEEELLDWAQEFPNMGGEFDSKTVLSGETGLDLLELQRSFGPYEDWLARPLERPELPAIVTARRAHSSRPDVEALAHRLREGSNLARRVDHHLVLHSYGVFSLSETEAVQLFEAVDGVDLETLLRADILPKQRPPVASMWLVRQVLEALSHAHSQGVAHGALMPTHIWVTREGVVKVDFGLAEASRGAEESHLTDYLDIRYTKPEWELTAPKERKDLYSIVAILFELMAGRPPRVAVGDRKPARLTKFGVEVPHKLNELIQMGLGQTSDSYPDVDAFEELLTRCFYVDFDADDDADGQQVWAHWVERARPRERAALMMEAPTENSVLAAETLQGQFTKAVMAWQAPVVPQEFTRNDFELGTDNQSYNTWKPGDEFAFELKEKPKEAPQPIVAADKAMAPILPRAVPEMDSQPGQPLVAPARPQAGPSAHPSYPPSQPSVIDTGKLKAIYAALWFFMGFGVGLIGLLVYAQSRG